MKYVLGLFIVTALYSQPWSPILATSRATNWARAGLPPTISYGTGGPVCPNGANCQETTPNPWTPPTRTQCGSTITPTGDTTGAADLANLNGATNGLANPGCTPGHNVILGPGQFYLNGTVNLWLKFGVGVRGSGPQSTSVMMLAGAKFSIEGGSALQCTSFGGTNGSPGVYTVGATLFNLSGCTGTAPHNGQILQVGECGNGTNTYNFSTDVCTGGAQIDNGGWLICRRNPVCVPGTSENQLTARFRETFVITNVSPAGAGAWNITVDKPLRSAAWASAQTPFALTYISGADANYAPHGLGIENMTIQGANGNFQAVRVLGAWASWVKGVRFVSIPGGVGAAGFIDGTTECFFGNNYLVGPGFSQPPTTGPGYQFGSDHLMLNNIEDTVATFETGGANEGNVIAYNVHKNGIVTDSLGGHFSHEVSDFYILLESNQWISWDDDDTYGGQFADTFFRNYNTCWWNPWFGSGVSWCSKFGGFSRSENAIGNVLGDPTVVPSLFGYSSNNGGQTSGFSFIMGHGQAGNSDPTPSSFRWGNWDAFTQQVRFCASNDPSFNSPPCGNGSLGSGVSEVPTALPGALGPFSNPNPPNRTIPPSFFLPIAAAHPNGGTGLSWWKVCDTWTTFPTSCSHYTTPPFPANGPDVVGGSHGAGFANDIPAAIAFNNLPVDTAYQQTWKPSGSTWSAGVESLTFPILSGMTVSESGNTVTITGATFPALWTPGTNIATSCASWISVAYLTVVSGGGTNTLTATTTATGLPTVSPCFVGGFSFHPMGPFQITGVSSACTSGATINSAAEIQITTSATITSPSYSTIGLSYALGNSSPDNGSSNQCIGLGGVPGVVHFPDVRQFDERVYQLDSSGPTVAPTSLGPWTQTQTINTGLTGTNFAPGSTVTWSLVAGAAPNGISGTCFTGTSSLAPWTCSITGTATSAGTFNFTIRATDGTSIVNTPFTVIVNAAPQVTTTCPLPSGQQGFLYTPTGSGILTNSGGTASFTWDLSAGTLPTGLSISGISIVGTPTSVGTSLFTLRVTDSNGIAGTRSCSLTITGLNAPFTGLTTSGVSTSGTILH